MAIGLLLIAAAAGMSGWNIYEDRQAGVSADELLKVYVESVEETQERTTAEENQPVKADEPEKETEVLTEETGESQDTEQTEESEDHSVRYSGENLYGVLSVPTLNLVLPVQKDWSYPKLRQTPCRYYGSVEDENLVVCAHNYSSHFGKLKNLRIGDAITFSDEAGENHTYTVACVEVLQPTAVEELTQSEWDLSLVTCTKGGKTRFVVRCEEEKE